MWAKAPPTTPRRKPSKPIELRTVDAPFLVSGERISTVAEKTQAGGDGRPSPRTIPRSPDYQIRATTVRIYEGDRVILKNATFYVGPRADLLLALSLSIVG